MNKFEIYVTGKEGIFDPAGETAKKALSNLGFEGIKDLSIGKYIELEAEEGITQAQVEEMCEKLLANPVIEDFVVRKA